MSDPVISSNQYHPNFTVEACKFPMRSISGTSTLYTFYIFFTEPLIVYALLITPAFSLLSYALYLDINKA